ncbi:hypothetical protein RJT34_15884 [Clitoria ternatea]|uniref:Vacuolar sorting protein 39/Transforming growth factor beta receptor-associated zinc finger domain-containing protein n=1 Tax=Clitoria ternatea TaxID=43366 RepID=A0AAN9J7C5_CLITE
MNSGLDDIVIAINPQKVEILQRSAIEAFKSENMSENLDSGNIEAKALANTIFETPVRERLQIFLQSSDLYDPEEVLDLIEGLELWLEKAILYRRLGQETLVLQILALLLEMYLDPQAGKDPMFTTAVRLLHNDGESLDPLQIVHNLSRAVDIDTRLSRLDERSRHVQINDESLCDSYDARLGTKLFTMYPDDIVVCYKGKNYEDIISTLCNGSAAIAIAYVEGDRQVLWS